VLLAQGRFWRADLKKGGGAVLVTALKESIPADLEELRDLRIEVPLREWHRLVRGLRCDRKLLGGILLDFGKPKDHVASAVAHDRLLHTLQRLVMDATQALVEEDILTLVPVDGGED
jgi:hypothetical protein